MIPDEIQSFYSFGHFFCAITKNGKKDFLRVCDYKYVKDLFTTNSTPKKTTPIACVFSQEISENSKIMFDLLGKVYILNGTNVQILREEELLTVINELVETSKYFEYAKSLAQMANLNHEIAYIEWKQAISILNQNNLPNHDRMSKAMDHFIKTIGYKSPSDVIQYYIDTNDQELIRYLWGDNEGDEPSENSLIMQSLPGSTEYRRLLISICVMEYSDCKIKNEKMDKTELSECKPMKILHYLATHAEYSDCRDDLINAYLSMDLKEYAIELADKYQNYEQAIRIKFCQNIEKTKEYIIKLLRKNDISEERKMKILIEYVREILARSNNDISSNLGNINENNPTRFITNLIKEKNEAYINQICLIFLPQLDSDNKMSLLFYQFFKKVSENCKKLNLIIPRVMNDVYIQHMLQLVDENAPQIVDQLKQILAHSHYTIDVAILSILDLKSDKSSLDKLKIELFTTVFKSHPEYSSQLIHLFVTENETKKLLDLIQGKDDQKKSETQDHNQELQNPNETKIQGQNKFETQDENENLDSFLKNATPSLFIETIAEFMTILIRGNEENKAKNTDENNFENSPNSETKNISTTQKRNENTIPSLFLEAIAEFIRHENYVDLIPELLEASQKYVPLPDIINFLLNLPKEYFHKNTKLNVKMVRGYILDWMNKMMKKEADLKKQLEMNQQEFKKLRDPNSEKYTIEELKKIREDYNEQILRGSEMNRFEDKKKMSNIMVNKQRQSDDNFETSEWKRPFSTLKMEKQENFLAGSCLEEQFLKEIESGIFIDGIETKNPKDEHPYTNECKAMLKEFDEAFERVVHNQ
ncbi:hypothetical protein TRFO_06818 [Tritrichomonas foetus]|uniref:Uncharacterized protein n=1 Tax=Tritrichomonas foetus TaxID=1144522 RepID=A0A1J4JVJ5_9EUKA|nr:hypothetical protein TRFO_06818 [Tritrichomonas foetus]|eukprot:OHT03153.1 hypothetical protein TRFO_06818 [Tritrichomonas foetus]